MRAAFPQPFKVALLISVAVLVATIVSSPAMAQNDVFDGASGVPCPDNAGPNVVTCHQSINYSGTELAFEPETPFQPSRDDLPAWNEKEQLNDDHYQVLHRAACKDSRGAIPGGEQGYPTHYRPSTFIRQSSFLITPTIPIPTATNPWAPLPPIGPPIEPQSDQRRQNAAGQPASCGR